MYLNIFLEKVRPERKKLNCVLNVTYYWLIDKIGLIIMSKVLRMNMIVKVKFLIPMLFWCGEVHVV